MIAYVDSSVLMRVALGERDGLREWRELRYGVASDLVRIECLRTIDRLRVSGRLPDDEVSLRRQAVFGLLNRLELIPLTSAVLERAAEPFPTSLATLDALHLASALLWKQSEGRLDYLLTHDLELARAAKASGLAVLGA